MTNMEPSVVSRGPICLSRLKYQIFMDYKSKGITNPMVGLIGTFAARIEYQLEMMSHL